MNQSVNNLTVGIIGDGQLALMLAESLQKMKANFWCFTTAEDSPMHTFYPQHITSDIRHFRNNCDRFTLENEFYSLEDLETLLREKKDKLFPDLHSYSFFADKISQRKFYQESGISSPKWMAIETKDDLEILKTNFSYPYVLKMSQGGYDGKGVRIIKTDHDLENALIDFHFYSGSALLVEEKVAIVKEVAQGFLRDADGIYTLLPLVETIQEDGVCNIVQYPPNVSPNVQAQVEFFLEKLVSKGLVGIFNFEFFVDEKNKVLINEGAPRTHNSQHLTIDASSLSQFDLLALYLTDPRNAPKKIETQNSVMVNILGKASGSYGQLKLPDVAPLISKPKLYGKRKSTPGRKLGHVNVIDQDGRADLLSVGKKLLKEYEL